MATIEKVQPIHAIDEGRQILNNNDSALNADITSLNNTLSNHNHNAIYYTKSEVDAIKKRSVITLNLPASAINTWAKVGSISMNANFGIVMPASGNIIDMICVKDNGMIADIKQGFPLGFNAGDVISVVYTQITATEVIRICRNGLALNSFVQTKDGQGFGPGLGNYLVILVIEM